MVAKPYDFLGGATLGEHSRQKHRIVRDYFRQYVKTRCQLPQQAAFRLAIVDGFAGGGRYSCGSPGSPIIFLEELLSVADEINISRAASGFKPLDISCLFIFNDAERAVVEVLKENVTPHLLAAREKQHLNIEVLYGADEFEVIYPKLKARLLDGAFQNVIFNLDQCGHLHVEWSTLKDIVGSFKSAEIFYTFFITTFLSFLQRDNQEALDKQLRPFGLSADQVQNLSEDLLTKKDWLGAMERLVFETLRSCAPFVSPFSINNPDGWRYWLVHLASSHRAREVYNVILHECSSSQAHFGRSGLQMLHYDPKQSSDVDLYLFDNSGRVSAKNQLLSDIPRFIEQFGDVLRVNDFYAAIYNATPAHSDDVRFAMIDNPDLEVITPAGRERQKAHTIKLDDVLRLKKQSSFHFVSGRQPRASDLEDISPPLPAEKSKDGEG